MQASLEVCIDNIGAINVCEAANIDRIELCSALELGGLTPSYSLMQAASGSHIRVYCMIRPTTGAFIYSDADIKCMLKDIEMVKSLGLAGVVLGAATSDRQLDLPALKVLCEASQGLGKTLHRVIDIVENPYKAIDQAIDLGFERILTSGGQLNVTDGMDQLAKMQQYAQGRIEIMAGSGVNAQNVGQLLAATGLSAVHSSCASPVAVSAQTVAFGFVSAQCRQTDLQKIKALQSALIK